MALSNWLTRDEWNAVYFIGLGEAMDGKDCDGLGDQMRLGIGALHRAGYSFTGIDSNESGGYEKRVQCCDGNETVLAEMLGGYGGFDKLGRAKEAISFLNKSAPEINISWLKNAVVEAEKEQHE